MWFLRGLRLSEFNCRVKSVAGVDLGDGKSGSGSLWSFC